MGADRAIRRAWSGIAGMVYRLANRGVAISHIRRAAVVGCVGVGLLVASKSIRRSYQEDSDTWSRTIMSRIINKLGPYAGRYK